MTPIHELLHSIWVDEDPIFYMEQHADEIAKALKDEDDRWKALKKELETFIIRAKALPLSDDSKSIAVSSFEAILGAMEELEEK